MQTSPPTSSTRRWFGGILAAVFGVLGAVAWWQLGTSPARALWGTGLLLAGVYYGLPPLRMPMYLVWMALVTPIGRAVSFAVLAAIYYAVITPIALVMRPVRRDRLTRSFDANAPSYWAEHDPGGETARYFRQS